MMDALMRKYQTAVEDARADKNSAIAKAEEAYQDRIDHAYSIYLCEEREGDEA
jgi:hypothetical protein